MPVQISGVLAGRIRVEKNRVRISNLAGTGSMFGIGEAGFRILKTTQLYFSQLMVPSFSVSQACAGDHPILYKECRWKCGDVTLTEASSIEIYTC